MTWPSRKATMTAGVATLLLVVSVMMARDGDLPPEGAPASASATVTRSGRGTVAVNDLKLELLQQHRPQLSEPERDPFRFQARQAPRQSAGPADATSPSASALVMPRPALPTGPPPPPPITLRFIGLVDAPSQAGRVAILSDGRGNVVYGKEGDTIEGRYRLLKIGADAVELAHVDGRGQQTVRLSGQ